jgi:hypothetical protein
MRPQDLQPRALCGRIQVRQVSKAIADDFGLSTSCVSYVAVARQPVNELYMFCVFDRDRGWLQLRHHIPDADVSGLSNTPTCAHVRHVGGHLTLSKRKRGAYRPSRKGKFSTKG